MMKFILPLALVVATTTGCGEAQSADGALNTQVEKETVAQLAHAAAADDEASSSSATGDSQYSGIRADVARFIDKTYALPQMKPHILAMARALEMMLRVDLNDKQAVRTAARQHSLALGCVYKLAGRNPAPPHPALIAQQVADATFNTAERRRGEIKFSKAASGMAIPALDSDCLTD